jgi:RNA polymerase sigma-70 factor (ECF subfamily)
VSVPLSPQNAYELGRRTYPTIDLPCHAFIAFVQERADTWGGSPERAGDLYLACACLERIPQAMAEFLARFGDRIPAYLGRLARNPDLVAEVRQVLLTRCLLGEGSGAPALCSYSGTGSLEGWLRASAVREALALNRKSERYTGDVEAALEARAGWADGEISLFKQIYRESVSRAFSTACAELDAEERALLRLHYVEGVTTANLAQIYKSSRATLIRRLAEARESLLMRVKAALSRGAGVAEQDFDSLLRLVKSQIDLRLSLVLKESESPKV